MEINNGPKILLIEPFYGGSHKEIINNLTEYFDHHEIKYTLITLPAKKWHWRARCSALQLYDRIPKITTETALFCSSVLNLAELLGLRPDLSKLRKIVYFHENQLIYPVQQIKERDVQYAYNQITTSLAADKVIFNSHFNRTSFVDNINKIMKLLSDNRPKGIRERIENKSTVLYFPVSFPKNIAGNRLPSILHIVWPHRWEFDKGPEDFFRVIIKLKEAGATFRLSVLGETFNDVPDVFDEAKKKLETEIIHFGYLESKEEYFEVLRTSHVVVSTAKHEFFGVSVLEAVYCGCFPLLPNSLVYPEIYPKNCLYSNLDELYKSLEAFCLQPNLLLQLREDIGIDFETYSTTTLLPEFINVLELNT